MVDKWPLKQPSKILDGFYLTDCKAISPKVMSDHCISYVINATPDLPIVTSVTRLLFNM